MNASATPKSTFLTSRYAIGLTHLTPLIEMVYLQMRQLAEKQAREEQELLSRAGNKASTSPTDPVNRPPSVSMPVSPHSSSGDVSPNGAAASSEPRRTASNGNDANDVPRKVSDSARSMPASRRHSGETDAVVEGIAKLNVNGYVDLCAL
jgi:hypothetical protein